MLQVLGTFFVGALGWIAANFVHKPLIEFLSLRREIQEELILLSHVHLPLEETKEEQGDEAYNEQIQMFWEARKKIRQLGSKLSAYNTFLNTPLLTPTSCLLHVMRYEIDDAAKQLLRLSTAYDNEDEAVTRYRVEVALRLPRSNEVLVQSILKTRKARQERRRKEAAAEQKTDADPS
jgi:hypothetical protein